jgi:hypothetical protein
MRLPQQKLIARNENGGGLFIQQSPQVIIVRVGRIILPRWLTPQRIRGKLG